jgi:hypothetical protein
MLYLDFVHWVPVYPYNDWNADGGSIGGLNALRQRGVEPQVGEKERSALSQEVQIDLHGICSECVLR